MYPLLGAWNFMGLVFIYKQLDTLRYATFMEFLKLSEGGGTFHYPKNNPLCVTVLYTKNYALKPVTFCYIYVYKQYTFHYVFYI